MPGGSVAVSKKVPVIKRFQPVPSIENFSNLGQQLVTSKTQHALLGIGIQRRCISQLVSVDGPVRCVHIYEDVGIPLVEYMPQRRPYFRSLELDVVAIEVETMAVCPFADPLRPVLMGSICLLRAESFVAVDIENRRHQQHNLVEHAALRFLQAVAHDHLNGFLAFDLAAVNIGLKVDNRFAGRSRRFGVGYQRPRADHHWNSLAAVAAADELHRQGAALLLKLAEEIQHVLQAGGPAVF